jgi:hypothetical protein
MSYIAPEPSFPMFPGARRLAMYTAPTPGTYLFAADFFDGFTNCAVAFAVHGVSAQISSWLDTGTVVAWLLSDKHLGDVGCFRHRARRDMLFFLLSLSRG